MALFECGSAIAGTMKEVVGYRFEAGVGNFSILVSPTHNLYDKNSSSMLASSEYFESTSTTGLGGVLKAKKSCKVLHLINDTVVDTTSYAAGDTIFTYPDTNVYTQYHNWIVI